MTAPALPEGLGLEFPPMLQEPSELGLVIALVEQNLGRAPRSVLEIGTYQGGTLARFRARWPLATIIGVDPEPLAEVDGCSIVRGRSQDEETRFQVHELHPEPFDLVHIDGDHSLAAVESDYAWAVGVLQARMVALHDVAEWQNPHLEVWKLWHEIKLAGTPCMEVRHNRDGLYGYGVVFSRG